MILFEVFLVLMLIVFSVLMLIVFLIFLMLIALLFVEGIFYDGFIEYLFMDFMLVDVIMLFTEGGGTALNFVKFVENGVDVSSSGNIFFGICVICLDVFVEGVCILCGYMVGCMFCLKDIESKKWGCFICCVKIN